MSCPLVYLAIFTQPSRSPKLERHLLKLHAPDLHAPTRSFPWPLEWPSHKKLHAYSVLKMPGMGGLDEVRVASCVARPFTGEECVP